MVLEPSRDLKIERLSDIVVEKPVGIDLRARGRTGLKLFGGYVFEEKLPQLQGRRGVDAYREMGDQDALCGGILFAYDKMTRRVPWMTERASDHPNDRQAEQFLQECMDDLSGNWIDFISEALTFLQYGFDLHEIVYKRRCGDAEESWLKSKYTDGRIGWRSFNQLGQDSITRWLTDGMGNIVAVEQMAAPYFNSIILPYDKLIHLRTQTYKGNPEGRSILRSAYRSWYIKRGIENIEAIGAERDLAGYPVILAPSEVMSRSGPDNSAMMDRLEEIIQNIRRDETEGSVFPSDRDAATGQLLYELKLLSAGGSRQFNTDTIIQRHDQRIALSMMADFMLLGQGPGSSGSYAMHSDKTNLFTQSLCTMLDIIEETFNRTIIPRLFRLNNFVINDYPRMKHGRVGTVDLKVMGEYVRNLAQSGAPMFPNMELETYMADIADMPAPQDPAAQKPISDPIGQGRDPQFKEVHDGDPTTGIEGQPAIAQPSPIITPTPTGVI